MDQSWIRPSCSRRLLRHGQSRLANIEEASSKRRQTSPTPCISEVGFTVDLAGGLVGACAGFVGGDVAVAARGVLFDEAGLAASASCRTRPSANRTRLRIRGRLNVRDSTYLQTHTHVKPVHHVAI